MNFENRTGAGVDFLRKGRSHFLNMRLVCLLLIVTIASFFF